MESLGISLNSGFGAALGILIGAAGGSKLANYLSKLDLNDSEKHNLANFVQIDDLNNTMVSTYASFII